MFRLPPATTISRVGVRIWAQSLGEVRPILISKAEQRLLRVLVADRIKFGRVLFLQRPVRKAMPQIATNSIVEQRAILMPTAVNRYIRLTQAEQMLSRAISFRGVL